MTQENSASYRVERSLVLTNGEKLKGKDFKLNLRLSEHTHDAIVRVDFTVSDYKPNHSGRYPFVDLSTYVLRYLDSQEVSLEIHRDRSVIVIRNIEEILASINSQPDSSVMYTCDNLKYARHQKSYVSYVLSEQVLFLYPTIFDFVKHAEFMIPTDCPENYITYRVSDTKTDTSNATEFIHEESYKANLSSLFDYFDCNSKFDSECFTLMRDNKLKRVDSEYAEMSSSSKRRMSKSDYEKSISDYENKQLGHMLKAIKERNLLNKQHYSSKTVNIISTYDHEVLPKEILVISEILTLPFWLSGDDVEQAVELKYSRI